MNRVSAVVVAAGEGRRFGGPKQFASLRGRSVLDWSLEAFQSSPYVDSVVLVLARPQEGRRYAARHSKIAAVVAGGEARQDSVRNGVEAAQAQEADILLIHDGARPLVTQELIERVIEAARETGAAVPGIALDDTIKETAGDRVVCTLDRGRLIRVQTPQGFACGLLWRALERARADGFIGTDEAALVERLGEAVAVVAGDARNIKITSPLDLAMAEAFLGH